MFGVHNKHHNDIYNVRVLPPPIGSACPTGAPLFGHYDTIMIFIMFKKNNHFLIGWSMAYQSLTTLKGDLLLDLKVFLSFFFEFGFEKNKNK